SARIIPYRGSWLDYEYDSKGIIWARIDSKRKFCATVILKALGYNQEQILETFSERNTITFNSKGFALILDKLSNRKV
ncbi:hypothetical protein NAI75_11055, partial [Francisella tularensis subsp. holarctica]|uniref:hypothetical protein n=1 Tax=Francisella tularensis TaxID=263 RepID=UPI00238199CD